GPLLLIIVLLILTLPFFLQPPPQPPRSTLFPYTTLFRSEAEPEPEEMRSGVLDILPNGSGFIRAEPYRQSREDVYVSPAQIRRRSEEHTSELQSRVDLVCRLLLEEK